MYHSDWSKASTKEKVSSSLDCLQMLFLKHFNTHNVWSGDISEPLTPKTKLSDNWFYIHCVKRYLLCANRWLRYCFDLSCTWMKALKVLTMSVSIKGIFSSHIPWRFLLSKNNISPADPDLELVLFSLWYWTNYECTHKVTTSQCLKQILLTVRNPTPHLLTFH